MNASSQTLQMRQFVKVQRKARLKAFLLILPLLAIVAIFFVLPIGQLLSDSVIDTEVRDALPHTVHELANWDGATLPKDTAFSALLEDLHNVDDNGDPSALAQRLNAEVGGYRNVIMKTLLRLPPAGTADAKSALIAADPAWQDVIYWKAIQHASAYFTSAYMLAALDLHYDLDNDSIKSVPPDQAVFKTIFIRTFYVGAIITLICLILGYPLSYWLSSLKENQSNLLLIFVLLPFWTSLIVRTAAWIVLLQNDGIISKLLQAVGLAGPSTQLSFNRFGVVVAMTHVLLPFMVLPLYSVMKGIPKDYVKAAISLGAHPYVAFMRVYVPQTIAGLAAGCLLTFILAIGYYVTPILIGGAADQMISYFIAFYTKETVNWGLASALASLLLVITLLLYYVYSKLAVTNQR